MQFGREGLVRLSDSMKVLLGKYVNAMGRSGQISDEISCSSHPTEKFPLDQSDIELKELFFCFVRYLLQLYSPLPMIAGKRFNMPYLINIDYPFHLAIATYPGRPVMSRQRYQEAVLTALNSIRRDPYFAGSERDQLLSIYNRCMSFMRANEKADFLQHHKGSFLRGLMNREAGRNFNAPTRYTSYGAHPPLKFLWKYR